MPRLNTLTNNYLFELVRKDDIVLKVLENGCLPPGSLKGGLSAVSSVSLNSVTDQIQGT